MLVGKLIGGASIGLIATVITLTNDQVSRPVRAFVAGDPVSQLSAVAGRAYRIGNLFTETVSIYTDGHTSMVFFGIIAVVLCGVLFRT